MEFGGTSPYLEYKTENFSSWDLQSEIVLDWYCGRLHSQSIPRSCRLHEGVAWCDRVHRNKRWHCVLLVMAWGTPPTVQLVHVLLLTRLVKKGTREKQNFTHKFLDKVAWCAALSLIIGWGKRGLLHVSPLKQYLATWD